MSKLQKEKICQDFNANTCKHPSDHIVNGEIVKHACSFCYLFIYLGFYVAFNTVQVIPRRVVGRAEETSTYSSLGLCTVNCRPTASNYQLSHLRPSQGSNPALRGGRRECYHSATVAPSFCYKEVNKLCYHKLQDGLRRKAIDSSKDKGHSN